MENTYTKSTRQRDDQRVSTIVLNGVVVGVVLEGNEVSFMEQHKKLQHKLIGKYRSAEDYQSHKGSIEFKFSYKSKNKSYATKCYFVATTCGSNFTNMETDYYLNEESSCVSRAFFATEPRRLITEGENDTINWNGRTFKIYKSHGNVCVKELK